VGALAPVRLKPPLRTVKLDWPILNHALAMKLVNTMIKKRYYYAIILGSTSPEKNPIPEAKTVAEMLVNRLLPHYDHVYMILDCESSFDDKHPRLTIFQAKTSDEVIHNIIESIKLINKQDALLWFHYTGHGYTDKEGAQIFAWKTDDYFGECNILKNTDGAFDCRFFSFDTCRTAIGVSTLSSAPITSPIRSSASITNPIRSSASITNPISSRLGEYWGKTQQKKGDFILRIADPAKKAYDGLFMELINNLKVSDDIGEFVGRFNNDNIAEKGNIRSIILLPGRNIEGKVDVVNISPSKTFRSSHYFCWVYTCEGIVRLKDDSFPNNLISESNPIEKRSLLLIWRGEMSSVGISFLHDPVNSHEHLSDEKLLEVVHELSKQYRHVYVLLQTYMTENDKGKIKKKFLKNSVKIHIEDTESSAGTFLDNLAEYFPGIFKE